MSFLSINPSAARDWDATFRAWSKPSSDTEKEKAANAERMIRDAIAQSPLASRNVEVFAQGSYRNRTNVRQDSDVDICVCCSDVFFPDYSMAGVPINAATFGDVDSGYSYSQFKAEVGAALVAKFGRGVAQGKKAFDVHANSYRLDADVVPTFEHRRYTREVRPGTWKYLTGTEFRTSGGQKIVNWPKQHYANGVAKNEATGNRFKYMTRAVKRLRNEMSERRIAAADPIPSYLVECLVWNVPNGEFGYDDYRAEMRAVLRFLFNSTINFADCRDWGEVNELKYLFHDAQPWSHADAHRFIGSAWDYVGY